ncbi:MAG: TetR/AcrR family transcriptional regulator [Lachnospiraceae bacterium]|nr:TetR/AcrR family transcriptional regulator [Lachnospiraceae bacterium]
MGYDYDQTHDRIMKSAMVHFMEKGFSGASIRQICADAGVTNGAFYAHFESKEDLFSSLVKPVVDGLQKLYEGENETYMEIHSVEDIRRSMEQTFSSNRLLIHFVFEHADIFRMILTAGNGTEYENFVDMLAAVEAVNTMEFMDRCRPYISNPEKLSEGLIRQISHFVVSAVFDGLIDGKTEEEVVHETALASEFALAGMKHFLGL